MLFTTDLDRDLVRRGVLPLPGAAAYLAGVAAILAIALRVRSAGALARAIRAAGGQAIAVARAHPMFFAAFALLAAMSLPYWFRREDPTQGALIFLVLAFGACATAALLPLSGRVRSGWRGYLAAAFLVYCAGIWIDVLRPGTFSVVDERAAGFATDTNTAAYAVSLLAAALLRYRRRPGLADLGVLYVSGLTIFITLSRGGALVWLALAAAYAAYVLVRSSGERRAIGVRFAATGALMAASVWATMQTFEYFSQPATQERVHIFFGNQSWFRLRMKPTHRTVPLIAERYGGFADAIESADPIESAPAPGLLAGLASGDGETAPADEDPSAVASLDGEEAPPGEDASDAADADGEASPPGDDASADGEGGTAPSGDDASTDAEGETAPPSEDASTDADEETAPSGDDASAEGEGEAAPSGEDASADGDEETAPSGDDASTDGEAAPEPTAEPDPAPEPTPPPAETDATPESAEPAAEGTPTPPPGGVVAAIPGGPPTVSQPPAIVITVVTVTPTPPPASPLPAEATPTPVAVVAAAAPPADEAEASGGGAEAEAEPASIDSRFVRQSGEYLYVDTVRVVRLKIAIEAIRDSPLVGYGNRYGSGEGLGAHNMYLAVWVDFGLPGFLAYSALMAGGLWSCWRLRFWPGLFAMGVLASWSMFSHTVLEQRSLFVVVGLLLALALARTDAGAESEADGAPREATP